MIRKGSWWISCKSDPRWKATGTSNFVGGFEMPHECKEAMEALKKQFGDPPDDAEWGYMKD